MGMQSDTRRERGQSRIFDSHLQIKDTPLKSLQYIYIGSHAFAILSHKIFLWICGTLTTLYRTLHMLLLEGLLSLYGHTMHVPTLCSIFPDRSMISLYDSTMHVIELEPYTQALFLPLKNLHFSSAWVWAKPMSVSLMIFGQSFFLLSMSVARKKKKKLVQMTTRARTWDLLHCKRGPNNDSTVKKLPRAITLFQRRE